MFSITIAQNRKLGEYVNFRNLRATKRLKKWTSYFDGTSEDNVKEFLWQFAAMTESAVLDQYVSTYSTKPRAIKERTYRLEKKLQYFRVRQTSQYGYTMAVTHPSLWPLGSGEQYYALYQEFGTFRFAARYFILSGKRFFNANYQSELSKHIRRWSRS